MKKKLAIILSLLLMLSIVLVGCTKDKETDKTKEQTTIKASATIEKTEVKEVTIVGKWNGSVDMTEVLNEMMNGTADEKIFEFKDLKIDLVMTFKEEGTCSLVIEEDSVKDMMKDLLDQVKPVMEDMIEATLKQQGIEMTVDEFLESQGTTLDEMMNLDELDTDEIVGGLENEGKYKVEGNKLWISEGLNKDIVEDDYNTFKIEDGKLTIDANEKDKKDEMAKVLFPLVLTKAE